MGAYDDIVKKYNPSYGVAKPGDPGFVGPTVPTKTVTAEEVAKRLNVPGLTADNPYLSTVYGFQQKQKQAERDHIEEQYKEADKYNQSFHPWETVKTYAKGIVPAIGKVFGGFAKEGAQDVYYGIQGKTPPKSEVGAGVLGGFLDLGPTIVNSVAGMAGIKQRLPYPGETLLQYLGGEPSDLTRAASEGTKLWALYELGSAGTKTAAGFLPGKVGQVLANPVVNRILGNVVGGQLSNPEATRQERLKQSAFDATFALLTEGITGALRRGKIPDSAGTATPEDVSAVSGVPNETGFVTKPVPDMPSITARLKAGSEIKTPSQPQIAYQPKKSLGLDAAGDEILAKTQVDAKTGRAIITYDQSLDLNPELKAKVFDHEFGHVLDKAVNNGSNLSAELSNFEGNAKNLTRVLKDFGDSMGMTPQEVAANLSFEIDRLGGGSNPAEKFANAVSEFRNNPIRAREIAPAFSAFLDHQMIPERFTVHDVSLKSLSETPTETAARVAEITRAQQATPEIDQLRTYAQKVHGKTPESAKGINMEFAALKRQIEGKPTAKEFANAEKYLESNHVGKNVNVNDEPAVVKKMSFGKVGVDFGDGKIQYVNAADIKPYAVTEEQVLSHLKQTALDALETKKKIFTNFKPSDAPVAVEAKPAAKGKPTEPLISSTGLKTGKAVTTKSFNPKSINAPSDVEALFAETASQNGDFSSQRVSKGNQDIKDLANLVGLSEDQLIAARPGSIANSETVTKARQIVLDKSQDLINFMKGVNPETATPAQLAGIKDRFVKLVAMQKAVAGFRTEASNVFRSLGIELAPGENATLRELGQLLKNSSDGLGLDPTDAALFSKRVATEMTLSTSQKVGQGALSTWYAAILSGPKTTLRNIISTSANILTELAAKAANPKSWAEIGPSVSGLFRGLGQGFEEAKAVLAGDAAATGKFVETGRSATRPEIFTGPFKTYGNVVESVGRFLNAQDTFLRAGAREMEAASLKVRGITDIKITDALAKAYAESTVYHGLPKGRFIGAMRDAAQLLRSKIPESKIIVPFVDTVANVMDRQFDYMPIFAQLRLRDSVITNQVERIAKEFGITDEASKSVIFDRLRSQQIGRMVLGTAISGAAISLAGQGRISGAGPSNFDERQQLIDSGWRPNSVKVGNTWVPYFYWGPLAGIFAMAGNVHDKVVYDKSPSKDVTDLMTKGILGWTQSQLDQSFLSGTANLLDVIGNHTSPKKYFDNLAAGLVPIPAAYSQTKDLFFRQQYETQDFIDKIKLKLGITSGLEPKLNAFGHQQTADIVYGISPATEKNDPVYNFLNKNQIVITKPKPAVNYVIPGTRNQTREFTPEEYTHYVERSGTEIYRQLSYQVGFLNSLNDEDKKKEVESLTSDIRARVRQQIFAGR